MSIRKIGKHALLFPAKDPRCISRTKQSFTKDANINNILGKYIRSGGSAVALLAQRVSGGVFADVSSGDDYRAVIDKTRAADEAFQGLDSGVRSMFKNDVSLMLDFIVDPANRDEAIELGLIEAPEPLQGAQLEPDDDVEATPPVVEPEAPVVPPVDDPAAV